MATSPIMEHFAFDHLPDPLKQISEQVAELAWWMEQTLEPGPFKSAGLRKLLEAMNCFVRQAKADSNAS